MASDLIYGNNEWQIGDTLICRDIELVIEVPGFYGPSCFTLYTAHADGKPVTGWLLDAMVEWVDINQAALEQKHIDANLYEDA